MVTEKQRLTGYLSHRMTAVSKFRRYGAEVALVSRRASETGKGQTHRHIYNRQIFERRMPAAPLPSCSLKSPCRPRPSFPISIGAGLSFRFRVSLACRSLMPSIPLPSFPVVSSSLWRRLSPYTKAEVGLCRGDQVCRELNSYRGLLPILFPAAREGDANSSVIPRGFVIRPRPVDCCVVRSLI